MKIGFIGLGIMGESMAENIVKKHNDKVYVFDFVKEKVDMLASKGAIPCENSIELAKNSDVIISMVPKSEHSRAVYEGIIDVLDDTKTCIDMSTIDPSVSVEISKMVKAKGAGFIDAPVVKSKPAAIEGTLGIYVGGDEKTCEAMKPILSYMGCNIIRMGDNGKGLVMKICHNALVSQIQNGVNETITLAKANGISIPEFTKAVSYGGAANWYLDGQAGKLDAEDYTTAFSIENMAKDVNICVNLARECGVKMPGEENALNVYKRALEKGMGKEDFRATIKVVREN
ncbi:MAG: NAD(P)-dependent oxidoreductase [Lachnospiraceae bacterium]|nr:NAD(P)-dependent oxidoreductase [Lachnospiraceae bacterium]